MWDAISVTVVEKKKDEYSFLGKTSLRALVRVAKPSGVMARTRTLRSPLFSGLSTVLHFPFGKVSGPSSTWFHGAANAASAGTDGTERVSLWRCEELQRASFFLLSCKRRFISDMWQHRHVAVSKGGAAVGMGYSCRLSMSRVYRRRCTGSAATDQY